MQNSAKLSKVYKITRILSTLIRPKCVSRKTLLSITVESALETFLKNQKIEIYLNCENISGKIKKYVGDSYISDLREIIGS